MTKIARFAVVVCLLFSLLSCSTGTPRSGAPSDASDDPFISLEDVTGDTALRWVRAHNDVSLSLLTARPEYAEMEREIRKIATARDRIPFPYVRNGYYWNFWQDQEHPKGLWRRTTEKEYRKAEPAWETILDIDLLSKQENESWVLKHMNCIQPAMDRCLIQLSRGGKDATIVREFDPEKKEFVKDGYRILAEAKTEITWIDHDRVLVGSDWGKGSLTESGYPRILKVWRRGTPIETAQTVFEAQVQHVGASPISMFMPGSNRYFVDRSLSFYETELFELNPGTLQVTRVPVPLDARLIHGFGKWLFFRLRKEWKTGMDTLPQGSLIAWDGQKAELVFAPGPREALSEVSVSRSAAHLVVLDQVNGTLRRVTHENGKWKIRRLEVPAHSDINLRDSDAFTDLVLVSAENFLVPTTLHRLNPSGGKKSLVLLKQAPERFDARGMKAEQFFAKSADGTEIPYFLIRKKSSRNDGTTPVIQYGYGGFEHSMTPYYLSATGKVWLEKGGAYALANIRGGGEFGPAWHQAALKKNRQKAFDDFIAVGEDLIRRKITAPSHLGIMGGSNGGLLTGAVLVQRPDLLNAAVIQVPLLDMVRFHKLLAGASWVGEYGSVEDPEMAPVLRSYSPYQRLQAGMKMPRPFLLTSTKDDRVHPGHARKFVARMESLGYPVLYYENIEGGHNAAADLEQRIKRQALEFTYFALQLGLISK